MARCLNPITVRNPAGFELRQLRFVANVGVLKRYGRDNVRPIASDVLTVPCGKCLACLKNKQNAMVLRCKREAEQRGSFGFMTLTYDDDHLPLVESMWKVNLLDGSEEQVVPPDFVSTGFHPEKPYLDLFRGVDGDVKPRYRSFVHSRILHYEFQHRVTPSVCRADVRQWLKQARIQYQRDYGEKLPDFSYVAISEYGTRTCRPHYHLAFFGLKRFHLNYLLDAWKFGKVKQVKMVAAVNRDKSSGFIRASKYIGKYMQKGVFECDSVKCGDAQRPRVCQSLHFGVRDIDDVRRHLLCFDMVGEYDPFTLRRSDGSAVGAGDLVRLVAEIPKRLVVRVDSRTVLPIPRILRAKIFYRKSEADPTKQIASALWSLVAASLRDQFDRERQQAIERFCAENPGRAHFEGVAQFAYFEAYCSQRQECFMQEDFQRFYARSHF